MEVFQAVQAPIRGLLLVGRSRPTSGFKVSDNNKQRLGIAVLHGVARTTSGRHAFNLCNKVVLGNLGLAANLVATNHSLMAVPVVFLFRDAVEGMMAYCNAEQAIVLINTSIEMIRNYKNHHQRHPQASASSQQRQNTTTEGKTQKEGDIEEEDVKGLSGILSLLSHLKTSNLDDVTPEAKTRASKAVIEGIIIVMQMLSQKMLMYPGVYLAFFDLLSECIVAWPRQVLTMQNELLSRFKECIEFALKHADERVNRSGLRAIRALTIAMLKFPKHANTSPQQIGVMQARILKILLVEKLSSGLVEPIADTLFPLILASPQSYSQVVNGFIQNASPQDRERARNGFSMLLGANGLKRELTTANREIFRRNIKDLMKMVRPVLTRR